MAGPVLDPLGIRHELAVALMVGRGGQEILLGGMAVIYGVPEAGLAQVISQQLDWVAAYSFMLFTLIYTPCLSTIAAIRKESRSKWLCALSVGYSLALAWCVAALFYQGRAGGWAEAGYRHEVLHGGGGVIRLLPALHVCPIGFSMSDASEPLSIDYRNRSESGV